MDRVGSSPFEGEASGPMAVQAMLDIAKEMKEIPELPSENPGHDVAILSKVEALDEGGILTYMEGIPVPYRGFPFFEMVEKIDTMKKMVRGSLSSMFHSMKKRPKTALLGVVFVPWLVSDLVKASLYALYRIVLRFKIKPKYYSKSMSELYRAFSVRGDASDEEYEFLCQVRDLVCMVMEMDNAYRFRFQDVLPEMDKVSLRKNPAKEVVRLLSILQERETGQDVRDTWTLLKTFLPPVLFLNKRLRDKFVQVLTELDLTKVALTVEDKWYAYPRKDYVAGFKKNPQGDDIDLVSQIKAHYALKEAKIKVKDESTKAHQEMFARHEKEFTVSPEIRAKIDQEIVGLQQSLQAQVGQIFEEERAKITTKHLSDEQKEILLRHREENAKMDKEFNERLLALDN